MNSRLRMVLLSVVAWAVMLAATGSDAREFGLGARAENARERAYIDAVYREVRGVEPNPLARERASAELNADMGTASLALSDRPSAADNSTLPWFPPIGNQGYQNSCVGWAAGYYYNTYVQAMDEAIDVSGWDPEHICSPAFLYPLLNGGLDAGASLPYAMARLGVIGCSNLHLTPYDQADYTSWPSEAAWVDALQRRTDGRYFIRTDTSEGLEAVKQLLANGRLAVVVFDMYGNLYDRYPEATIGIDSAVYYRPDGPYRGGHAVVLVGYDDAKAYRDDRDGLIHQGAFLAANSWGSSWGVENSTPGGGRGYFWVAYNAFLEGTFAGGAFYTGDREDYRPTAYALVGISHPQRGFLTLSAGAGPPSYPAAVTEPVIDASGGIELGVDDLDRIALDMTDLTDFMPACQPANVFVELFVQPNAIESGLIAGAEFFMDPEGDGSYEIAVAPDVPVVVRPGAEGAAFLPLFTDLTWGDWAYDEIEACFCAGVVSGYPDGTYHPEYGVTRDQMAVYISRALAGGDAVPDGPAEPTFLDVPPSHWAYDYIEYAADRDIVTGYEDGTYQPALALDRAQMAVFLARSIVDPTGEDGLAEYAPPAVATFPDVQPDSWAYAHVEYIADPTRAIAQGYSDGRYHPEYVCTRDQMAVYIARAFDLPV